MSAPPARPLFAAATAVLAATAAALGGGAAADGGVDYATWLGGAATSFAALPAPPEPAAPALPIAPERKADGDAHSTMSPSSSSSSERSRHGRHRRRQRSRSRSRGRDKASKHRHHRARSDGKQSRDHKRSRHGRRRSNSSSSSDGGRDKRRHKRGRSRSRSHSRRRHDRRDRDDKPSSAAAAAAAVAVPSASNAAAGPDGLFATDKTGDAAAVVRGAPPAGTVPDYASADARVPLSHTLGAGPGGRVRLRPPQRAGGSHLAAPLEAGAAILAAKAAGGDGNVWSWLQAEARAAAAAAAEAARLENSAASVGRYWAASAVAAQEGRAAREARVNLAEQRAGALNAAPASAPRPSPLTSSAAAPSREQKLAAAIAAGYARQGLAGSVVNLAEGASPAAIDDSLSAAAVTAPTPLVIPLESPSSSALPTGSPAAPAVSPPAPADDDGSSSPHQRLGETRGAFLARRTRRLNAYTALRPRDERGWRCLVRTQWESVTTAAGAAADAGRPSTAHQPPPTALRATALSVARATLTRAVAACPRSAQLQLDRLAVLCDMAALPAHLRQADDGGFGGDGWPTTESVNREWRALLLGAQPRSDAMSSATPPAATPFTACSRLWLEYLTWLRGCNGNGIGAPARVHAAAADGIAVLVALRAAALAQQQQLRSLAPQPAAGESINDAVSAATRLCDDAAMAILAFVTHYDRAWGDTEAATAAWQAAFEFSCGAPLELSGADDGSLERYRRRVAWFAAFWASEAPRVGDVGGPATLAARLNEVGEAAPPPATAADVTSASGFAAWFTSVTAGLSGEKRAAAGLPPRQPAVAVPVKRRSRFTAAAEPEAGAGTPAPSGGATATASMGAAAPAAPAFGHGNGSAHSSYDEPQWGYLGDDETVAAAAAAAAATTQAAVSAKPTDDDDDLSSSGRCAARTAAEASTGAAAVQEVSFYSRLHGYRITARAIVPTAASGCAASAPSSSAAAPVLLLDDGGASDALYVRLLMDLTRPTAQRSDGGSAAADAGALTAALTPQLRPEQAAPAHPLSRWLAAEDYRAAHETRPLRAVETDPQWYLRPSTAPTQSRSESAADAGWAPVAGGGSDSDDGSDGDGDDDERRYYALELAAAALVRGDVTPSSTVPLARLLPLLYPFSRAGQRELAVRFLRFLGVRATGPAADSAYGVGQHSSRSTECQWWDVAFGPAAEEPAAPPGTAAPSAGAPVIVTPTAVSPTSIPSIRGVLTRVVAAFPGDSSFRSACGAFDAAVFSSAAARLPPSAAGGGLAAAMASAWRELDTAAAVPRPERDQASTNAVHGAAADALSAALAADVGGGALPSGPGGDGSAAALASTRALLASQAAAALAAVGAIADAWVAAVASLPRAVAGGALQPLAEDAAFSAALQGVAASNTSGELRRLGLTDPASHSPAPLAVLACGTALLDYCRTSASSSSSSSSSSATSSVGGAPPDPRGALTILSSALRLTLACARTLAVAQLRVAGAYAGGGSAHDDAGDAEADAADADVSEYLHALAACGGMPPPTRTSTLAALLLKPRRSGNDTLTGSRTNATQSPTTANSLFPLSSPALDALGVPPSPVADVGGGVVDTSTAAGRAIDALLASAELLCAFRVRLLRLHAALVPSSPPRLLRLAMQTLACLFPGRHHVAWSPAAGVDFCGGNEAAAAGWRGIETAAFMSTLSAHAGADAPLALRCAPLLTALVAAGAGRGGLEADGAGSDVHAAVARVKRAAQATLQSPPLDAPPAPPSALPRSLPLLWRAVARFHLQAGDPAAAVATLAAGAAACPWSKALALDLLRRGRAYLPPAAIAASLCRARDEGGFVLRVAPLAPVEDGGPQRLA